MLYLLVHEHFRRRLHAGDSTAVALRVAQNYLRLLTPSEVEIEPAQLKTTLQNGGAADVAALQPLDETRDARHREAPTTQNTYSHPVYWPLSSLLVESRGMQQAAHEHKE
jgi:CHAT domain-containing protein